MIRKDTIYSIDELSFTYPGSNASREVTLNLSALKIRRGEITVLRGHNGSGKTTLMKLLSGLLSPDKGKISNPENLRSVLVQQEPYLFHGTVAHNLSAPLRFQGRKHEAKESLIRETLALVGLEGFENRKARELSGGEKKRAAIARALVSTPDVLFLDEPDANVDEATSRLLVSLILELKKQGITVILCSHSRSFAYRTADRIIHLDRGEEIHSYENIFKGHCSSDEKNHFFSGNRDFYCYTGDGYYNTLVVPPESISLSRSALDFKEGNRLEGILRSLEAVEGDGIMAELECCSERLYAYLSRSEMALRDYKPDEKLKLYFSAASVKLY